MLSFFIVLDYLEILDIKKPAISWNFYCTILRSIKMVPEARLELARFVGGGF